MEIKTCSLQDGRTASKQTNKQTNNVMKGTPKMVVNKYKRKILKWIINSCTGETAERDKINGKT